MVVHDLAYDRLPETAPHMNARWRRRFEAWLHRAAGVLVPSASTEQDLLEAHDVEPGRVTVTPLGVDAAAYAPVPGDVVDATLRKFGDRRAVRALRGRGRAAQEPRDARACLRDARARHPARDRGRVRCDGIPKAVDRLDAVIADLPPDARARIVRTGYVSDKEKVALLTGATLLAYPSLYEGFGFPVLEGFAAGVPVLTSDVASLPEVAGDAAVMVDPHDEVGDRGRARAALRRRRPPRDARRRGARAGGALHLGGDGAAHRRGAAPRPRPGRRVDSLPSPHAREVPP